MSSSEALKTLERSSSGLSMGLGSSVRAGAKSVSTTSEGSSSGVGSSLSVCVASLTGLLSADVFGVSLVSVGDLGLEFGEFT